ncbi:hypothetical protein F5B22DRAFT_511176 [Xylaria bambusicola]|uniref:uncharacterized protein n=1 Tax=Xylaria bambusicola TaxID=326684 RepID=UPI00200811F0|nr:uncharacterized protein F5B22DRAFT_511176 [Xylaria bambusicola]KAI0521945.1 hypothetical protein F5B22DRAFT_511176 [Xylaria bambusicola]
MPAVSFPVQQNHNIVCAGFIHLERAQFLLTFAAAIVAPIAVLALVVSFSRKYKDTALSRSFCKRPTRTAGSRYLKQSREFNTVRIIMSPSRKSDVSSLGTHRTIEKDVLGGRRDEPRGSSGRQRYWEESGALKAKADERRNPKNRPPPAMPLTPPDAATTIFTFQDRRLSVAASTHNDFDPALPSLDIDSPESTSTLDANTSSPISPHRSYTTAASLDPHQPSSSTGVRFEDTLSTFAPSSFPSSSPILPLAPHTALHLHGNDVTDETNSVTDDSGADWKRHTRVYGGGVCLACLASGGDDGGFYGENVPLDQRR